MSGVPGITGAQGAGARSREGAQDDPGRDSPRDATGGAGITGQGVGIEGQGVGIIAGTSGA